MNSKLPWKVSDSQGGLCVIDADEYVVVNAGDSNWYSNQDRDNYELIVQSCNAHADLLAACKAGLEMLRLVAYHNNNDSKWNYGDVERADLKMEEAIKKAEKV